MKAKIMEIPKMLVLVHGTDQGEGRGFEDCHFSTPTISS